MTRKRTSKSGKQGASAKTRRNGVAWDVPYRTSPFVAIRQTGWDEFTARAECWADIEIGMDPATLKILTWFGEADTATNAYAALKTTLGVSRTEFAGALSIMLEAGLLGMEGMLHSRIVPKVCEKVRLGRPFDGGYVVPANFVSLVDGMLSFGVGDDLSFENDFCDHHPGRVLAFDHTIENPPYARGRVEFVSKGVAARSAANMVTLKKMITSGPFRAPMVKMDIEGCEWQVLAACDTKSLGRVPIFVFELHGMLANTPQQISVFEALLSTHEPIHVHANNNGTALVDDGRLYPSWIEVTFAHRDVLGELVVDTSAYPTEHDYPNSGDLPDWALDWWHPQD